MLNEDEVQKIVEGLVKERFPDANILSVTIKEDFDFDDREVLRVKVVFESDDQTLDSGSTSGFLRHLRPVLSEVGVRAFPVMSFISNRDVGAAV